MVTRREPSTASRDVPRVRAGDPGGSPRGRAPVPAPAVLLLVLGLVTFAVTTVIAVRDATFASSAAYGWVVVQEVGDGTVTAVQDLDPDGRTLTLDLPTDGLSEGSRIAVRYDADDPYDVVPADSLSNVPLYVGGGLAGAVLVTLGGFVWFRARSSGDTGSF